MASITNNTRKAVILPTGHTVARLDRLETTNVVLRSPDNVRTIATMVAAKMIEVEYDPDPIEEAAEATASVIDAPDRALPGMADGFPACHHADPVRDPGPVGADAHLRDADRPP